MARIEGIERTYALFDRLLAVDLEETVRRGLDRTRTAIEPGVPVDTGALRDSLRVTPETFPQRAAGSPGIRQRAEEGQIADRADEPPPALALYADDLKYSGRINDVTGFFESAEDMAETYVEEEGFEALRRASDG